jgi:hypothetical protein
MNKIDTWFNIFWCLLGVSAGILIADVAANAQLTSMRKTAIEKGVAEYNSTSGDWQWKSDPESETQ